MSDLMQAVMQINKQRQDNMDQWASLYDNAKVADAMVKANPDLPQRMGFLDAKHYQSLSAQDRIAATTGYIKGQGVQEEQTRQQEMQARMKDWQAQADERTAQVDEANSFSNFAQTLDGYANPPVDPSTGQPAAVTDPDAKTWADKLTPAQKMGIRAAATMGKTNPRVGAAMIKGMMPTFGPDAAAGTDSSPSEMTMSNGDKVYYQKGTRNPLVMSPFSKSAARVDEINAQADASSGKGLLPEGTTFSTTANGLAIAELPDGTTKFLGRAPTAAKDRKSFFAQFMGGTPNTNAPKTMTDTGRSASDKVVTPALAQQYLQKAGGDKAKARALATADGYTF